MDEQQQEFDRICGALRKNTRYHKGVFTYNLPKMTDPIALKLSQALSENKVVTQLSLVIEGMSLVGVRGFVDFIERSPSLRSLIIYQSRAPGRMTERELKTSVAVADELLHAAGHSGTIEHLDCSACTCEVVAFANCLGSLRQSLKYLRLPLRFHGEGLIRHAQQNLVADALRSLTSLESLYDFSHSQVTALALERMTDHRCLKHLQVAYSDEAAATRIRNFLLQSSTPLERLLLIGGNRRLLSPILSALCGENTVRELIVFIHGDPGLAVHIVNLLHNNQRIEKLDVYHTNLQITTMLLGSLVGEEANRSLRELRLVHDDTGGNVNDEEQKAFWKSLINIVVEGLSPQLKGLRCEKFLEPKEELMTDLVQAFANNTSLTKVAIDCLPSSAKQAINYFGMRNKYRPLLASSASKPQMLSLFGKMDIETYNYDEAAALSVIYDTLRDRNDWTS